MSPDLDLACARVAAAVRALENVEDLSTAAAAVLAQNGPYACFLYLSTQMKRQKQREAAEAIHSAAFGLLRDQFGLPDLTEPRQIQDELAALSADLEKLLLAKALLAHMLMYLRYHAKAKRTPPDRAGRQPGAHR
jgi:hypothetical protein